MGATREQKKRKKTFEHLEQQMLLNGYEKQFYLDQIDEYMIYYDNLATLNEKLKEAELDTRAFNEILKEKRQVTKEMRNILSFLNLQPTGEMQGVGDDEDEIL